jgi:hypothetical protein
MLEKTCELQELADLDFYDSPSLRQPEVRPRKGRLRSPLCRTHTPPFS